MRDIPQELIARIESGAATLCHVWRLMRTDGAVTGFTDHDRDLVVGGVTCRAGSGWTAGAMEAAVGPQAGSAAATGGLDDDALGEADIKAGLLNINSPIARGLIGKEEGDVVDIQTPGGVKSYEILEVKYV